MNKYKSFLFKDYKLDYDSRILSLHYSYDNQISFTETYHFDFDWEENLDLSDLDRACQTLFFMAGVSYYKTYLAPEICIEKGKMTPSEAEFFSKTYQKGLGEFFYVNQLDPKTTIKFPLTHSDEVVSSQRSSSGLLIGIGGGKDSLVSVDLLHDQPKVATWTVGHRTQLEPLVKRIGLPHFWVYREWDKSLLDHNISGGYNGHVPFSAILASVGTIVAVLSGYRDVVVSNEQSANESTLEYNGVSINHQYSKSSEFESDYQSYLHNRFGDNIRYYSLLRPLSELRIAELFASKVLDKYRDVFSSCNRAFVHTSDRLFWCGECPKCAFTYLILSPFVNDDKLTSLFGGKNLLTDPTLELTYRQLLGIEGDKPLDCVGEIKESRTAMRLAQAKYPELISKYRFDLPTNYDFRTLYGHHIPTEIYSIIANGITKNG